MSYSLKGIECYIWWVFLTGWNIKPQDSSTIAINSPVWQICMVLICHYHQYTNYDMSQGKDKLFSVISYKDEALPQLDLIFLNINVLLLYLINSTTAIAPDVYVDSPNYRQLLLTIPPKPTIILIIFWDFLMFYHKWNDARLLFINMVYTSCLTSWRTT